jgi:hypothetical protein
MRLTSAVTNEGNKGIQNEAFTPSGQTVLAELSLYAIFFPSLTSILLFKNLLFRSAVFAVPRNLVSKFARLRASSTDFTIFYSSDFIQKPISFDLHPRKKCWPSWPTSLVRDLSSGGRGSARAIFSVRSQRRRTTLQ